jgi:diamine N-acetyltransferase
MTITYRPASPDDAAALAELGSTSFCDAFAHLYSAENLSAFLAQAYSVAALSADLANPNRLFRIAECGSGMVGYCKLGFDMTFDVDRRSRRTMELKQLYTRGDQTGRGIGAVLMDWALAEAQARKFDDIILSVWSQNFAAQRFYGRYGFQKIADTFFMVGEHRDEEFLLGLKLTD